VALYKHNPTYKSTPSCLFPLHPHEQFYSHSFVYSVD